MSDTNRYISRRPARPAPRAAVQPDGIMNPPSKVEALRKLVAAGQYQVNPRWLASKIFQAARVKLPE